jgi:exosortase
MSSERKRQVARIATLILMTHRTALLGWMVSLVLLIALYWSTLAHLVWTWSTDENYSHGYFVPVIAAYFAYEASRRKSQFSNGSSRLGTMLLVTAIISRLLTTIVPVGFLADLSLILGLAGLVGLMQGSQALRRYRFSLAFLIFMVPLPIALYTSIATPLQLLVSRFATSLLNRVGIPVLCQGNTMILPGDIHLFVAEACSGIRQLTGFLALTTAVAFLTNRPVWWRATLIMSSIPIALLANVSRVTLTAWLCYSIDPALAFGLFHTFEGLLMMVVGLLILGGECALLNTIAGRSSQGLPSVLHGEVP